MQPFARSVDTLLNLRRATISDSPHRWLAWSPGVLCSTSCLEGGKVLCHAQVFTARTIFAVFQSNAAARGSSPAAAGRCSVSPCPGSVTAGRHARTRATRWTVPVSTPAMLPDMRHTPRRTTAPRNVLGSLKSRKQLGGPEYSCFFAPWMVKACTKT